MSLKSCKECGKQVSSNAKTCPHCGAKLKMGFFMKTIIGFFVLIFIGAIISNNQPKPEPEKDKIKYCRVHAEMFVEKSLKNPDSYKYVNFTLYESKDKAKENNSSKKKEEPKEQEDRKVSGVLEYRGTNGFGAIITESIAFDFLVTAEDCKIINVRK